MLLDASFYCSYCGEKNDTTVDPSTGRFQNYVEDCQVCCRPNVLRIEVYHDDDDVVASIDAEPEMDGF